MNASAWNHNSTHRVGIGRCNLVGEVVGDFQKSHADVDNILQGTNISQLWKMKINFNIAFSGDMLVGTFDS